MSDALERLMARLAVTLARIGGGLVVVIALMVAVDVVARNVTGRTLLNSFQFSSYLYAAALSFGMSYVGLCGAHIRLDFITGRFPVPLRRVLDLAAFVSLALLSSLLFVYAAGLAHESWSRGVMSTSAVAVPLAIPQAVWAFGFGMFALTSILMMLRHALLLAQGRGAEADRIGRFGTEEEIAEALEDAARGARP